MKTFGELTREEKIELVTAWIDGAEIEVFNSGWVQLSEPSWYKEATYRIKQTKPSINWDHVHEDYKWLTVDCAGRSYLYKKKPSIYRTFWGPSDGSSDYCEATAIISCKPGTCDWKDSLVERPKK